MVIDAATTYVHAGASIQQRIVGLGYLSVCGSASVWGDGVVPLPSAHLEGAPLLLGTLRKQWPCCWPHPES